MSALTNILPLLVGWTLDLFLGDPLWMPHPVVWFGKMISMGEKHLNKGQHQTERGAPVILPRCLRMGNHMGDSPLHFLHCCRCRAFAFYISPFAFHPPLHTHYLLVSCWHHSYPRGSPDLPCCRPLHRRRTQAGGSHRRP